MDMQNNKIFLVAELSANHNQDKNLALKTIKAAKDSGADAIKLQTYTPDCMSIDCDLEDFRIKGTLWGGKKFYDLYQEAMTPWEWHAELFEYAQNLGLVCFSSPFSKEGVDFLESLGNPIYKVASFEIVDLELIAYMARLGKPMILSKGIANKEEIQDAINVCKQTGNTDITLLQCTSSYPAPLHSANLSLIPHLVGIPSNSSTSRTAFAICANSSGSRLNALSTPPSLRFSIKCFSITFAPIVAAAIGAVIPKVWSDNPTSTPKSFFKCGIRLKFALCKGAG